MAGLDPQPDSAQPQRRDQRTGLPLPDPYPEYITCPHCGELEVEVWCYQRRVRCHHCGHWIAHVPASCRGTSEICRPYVEKEDMDPPEEHAPEGGSPQPD